jgi:orotate phosphoribosyltransferase
MGDEMDERRKILIEKLVKINALRFGDFTLSSGKKSTYYVDIKHASTFPDFLEMVAKFSKDLFEKEGLKFDRIACIELGGVPLAVAISMETGKPFTVFRKEKKDYGVKSDMIGEIKEYEKILVVEDVTTTGFSALSVVKRVEERGGKVSAVLVVVDRNEGAEELIVSHGVKFIPLITSKTLLSGNFL